VADAQSSAFEQYLSLFRRERGNLMRREGSTSLDQYKRGVYSTLDLSYSLISPLAREFLGVCSQLHYTDISLSMILAASEKDFEDQKGYGERPESHVNVKERLRSLFRPHGNLDESHIREIIQSLVSLSLVQVTIAKDTILLRYHPLVHAWANEKTTPESTSLHLRMAITIISTSIDSISPSHSQYLSPHIISIAERAHLSELHITDLTIMGEFIGSGVSKVSLNLLEEAARQLKERVVSSSSSTADVYNALAGAYIGAGKLDKAEEMLLQALETERSLSGDNHLEIMKLNQGLGGVYWFMGRYK
ncbi:12957_t:CDS:1, partial [Acaulospora colombiana]